MGELEEWMANYFDDKNFYDLMFSGGIYYWLASRYANCNSDNAYFEFQVVYDGELNVGDLFDSLGYCDDGNDYGLRAVVYLGSNVKFENGDGSEELPYELDI